MSKNALRSRAKSTEGAIFTNTVAFANIPIYLAIRWQGFFVSIPST